MAIQQIYYLCTIFLPNFVNIRFPGGPRRPPGGPRAGYVHDPRRNHYNTYENGFETIFILAFKAWKQVWKWFENYFRSCRAAAEEVKRRESAVPDKGQLSPITSRFAYASSANWSSNVMQITSTAVELCCWRSPAGSI